MSRGDHRAGDINRILRHANGINSKLDELDKDALDWLQRMLEIDPEEATACLEGQARAAAREILTSAEALTIYESLTPAGWEPGTRLEVKMTIVFRVQPSPALGSQFPPLPRGRRHGVGRARCAIAGCGSPRRAASPPAE